MKILDASAILTRLAMDAGANWVTVSAAAHIETIRSAKKVTDRFDGEVQIELYELLDNGRCASLGRHGH